MNFYDLHQQAGPLVIANVWDVASAQIAEKSGYKALGTSSAAIAGMLGYPDGEAMSFSELKYIVGRIASSTSLPLSVDLESGYSREPEEIAGYIKELSLLGVVGINLEDSKVKKARYLLPADQFGARLAMVKELLVKAKVKVFLNIRTDTFLLNVNKPVEETIKRIGIYEQHGADGIFTPCIVNKQDITQIVNSTALPINVMCMPGLPGFNSLRELGVKRISMGNFLFDKTGQYFENLLNNILKEKSFKSIC